MLTSTLRYDGPFLHQNPLKFLVGCHDPNIELTAEMGVRIFIAPGIELRLAPGLANVNVDKARKGVFRVTDFNDYARD